MNRLASSCAFGLTCTLLSGATPGATAWAQPSSPALYAPVTRPEPSQPSSLALHALAKEAHLSLLADADDVDQASPTQQPANQQQPATGSSSLPLRALLNQWSQNHTLNWKRLSDNTPSGTLPGTTLPSGTLLVWSAPDPMALVAKWRAEVPVAPTPGAPATPAASTATPPAPLGVFSFDPKSRGRGKSLGVPAPLTASEKATQELTLALRRAFTPDPAALAPDQKAASPREKAVVDLPAEVREKILALAAVAPATEGVMDQGQVAVLGEEFWKSATLHLQNSDLPSVGADGKAHSQLMPILFVTGHFRSANGQLATLMLGLATWPQAPTPQPPVAGPPIPGLPVAAPPAPTPEVVAPPIAQPGPQAQPPVAAPALAPAG